MIFLRILESLRSFRRISLIQCATWICVIFAGSPRPLEVLIAADKPARNVDAGWEDGREIRLATEIKLQQEQIQFCKSVKQAVYGQEEENGILRLNWVLKRELAAAEETHKLPAESVKKLLLAGRGDISRFVDQVSSLADPNGKHLAGVILGPDLHELRRQYAREEVFGRKSMFGKTLKRLVSESNPKHDSERDRRYHNHMSIILRHHVGTENPLTDDQKVSVDEFLQYHIQNSPVLLFGDFDEMVVRLQEIPEAEYRKVLSAEQLRRLRQSLERHVR